MPTCKYELGNYKCEYDSDATTGDAFCILHSPPPSWKQSGSALSLMKDEEAFKQAFTAYREKHGDIFIGFVFPASFTFGAAEFSEDASFWAAKFSGKTDFSNSKFLSRTAFISRKRDNKILQIFCLTELETAIDFTDVIIEPPDAIVFRDADLTKCRFLGTDLRKAEITNAIWPQIGNRLGVYDEKTLSKDKPDEWAHVESLYRQLKQNYEDRRDYERARDFHYGEKEMRRRSPKASRGLRFLLTLYWAVSGYGERLLRPLIWAAGVLAISAICYLWWGLLHLRHADPVSDPVLHWTNKWEVGLYSLKVMTLLKPTNFEPVGFWGDVINTLQSILGPVLIGLFALAIRQRLKR